MSEEKRGVVRPLPCPLCGCKEPINRGHGIECPICGLWLGDGTKSWERGGIIKSWNTRLTQS